MITCNNCGAGIDNDATECPYCHAVQLQASERKYMNDLYSMNDRLDDMDDNAIKVELKTTFVRLLILVGVYAVCITLGVIFGVAEYKSIHDNSSDRRKIVASYEWYDENVDLLNQYYADRDFDSMYQMYMSDRTYTFSRNIKYWEHCAIFSLYSYEYHSVLSSMSYDLYKNYNSSYVSAYSNCVDFMAERNEYLEGNGIYGELTEEDIVISEEWADTVAEFVRDKLKVTDEEFARDVAASDSYSYDDMKNIAEEYYKRLQDE